MKQRDIVSLLRHEFGHHEVTVFSASAKNRAGVLDCEIAYDGESIWIEIKIDRDTLKPLQEKFMERHGNSSYLLYYYPDTKTFVLFKYSLISNEITLLIERKTFKEITDYITDKYTNDHL